MRTSFLLLALAGATTFSACAQKRVPTKGQPAPAAPVKPTRPRTVSTIPIHTAPKDTALVFERTGCHGTCPIYSATVFRDGRVEYEGEQFVPNMGHRTLSLPPATVQAILDEARRINFNGFKPEYTDDVMDLPSTVVTVYQPGQRAYRVLARSSYPDKLRIYLDYLKARLDPLAGLKPGK